MIRNRFYYSVKPALPRSLRLGVRSWITLRQRAGAGKVWPILPGSERPPEGWPGWPNGKKFAFVLSHDVEGKEGLERTRRLMQLEASLGFRSSFNFIPEGDYSVPQSLREELTGAGFEVGVHDLKHDGKLFRSRTGFAHKAAAINTYLKEWKAVGFRAGFMLHNLDWIGDLNVLYDASTFDTDPFEPQPDGVGTIFPFWRPRFSSASKVAQNGGPATNGDASNSDLLNGYVELPYTLAQDSTVFLLLRERHPDIWFQKLDWIAKHGGMAMLDTHPDYMDFGDHPTNGCEYPVAMYKRFLEYLRSRYPDAYWHALPREVAQFVRDARIPKAQPVSPQVYLNSRSSQKPKIWIDLDNTPHVPFFEPIIDELRARGFPLVVTARDAFQVCDLADKKGMSYIKVGRHYGKNRLMKGMGLAYRAMQLAPLVLKEKPVLGVSHGARSQLIISNWLGVPSVLIEDYEYCQFPPMMKPTWLMAPQVIPDAALCLKNGKVRKYPGIKEDVYAWKLSPDDEAVRKLGISNSEVVVTVRPPATEAHYHNPESETLFEAFMNRACQTPQVKVVLLPRNSKQAEFIRSRWAQWFENQRVVIPTEALDGLNLIWHSDLVVSGGGTMNREAAALGVPVYSIFRGTIGAVDHHLHTEGRLVLIESAADVDRKIELAKRPRKSVQDVTSKKALEQIVQTIQELAESIRG